MSHARLVPTLAALTILSLAPTAQASFPAGVWARVDQVTLDAKNPSSVRIDGIFMVANQKPAFPQYAGYSVPQYGYMHYDCPGKQLATCVMEWNELQAIAGSKDSCRGWGDSSLPDNGSVRPSASPESDPDSYPISMGVLIGFTPCDALAAWALANPRQPVEPGTDTDATTTDATTTGVPATTDATTTGEPPADATTGEPPATSDAPPGDGEPTTGDPTATAGSSGTSNPAPIGDSGQQDDDKAGCACTSTGRPDPAALLLLAGLALVRRRRSA